MDPHHLEERGAAMTEGIERIPRAEDRADGAVDIGGVRVLLENGGVSRARPCHQLAQESRGRCAAVLYPGECLLVDGLAHGAEKTLVTIIPMRKASMTKRQAQKSGALPGSGPWSLAIA